MVIKRLKNIIDTKTVSTITKTAQGLMEGGVFGAVKANFLCKTGQAIESFVPPQKNIDHIIFDEAGPDNVNEILPDFLKVLGINDASKALKSFKKELSFLRRVSKTVSNATLDEPSNILTSLSKMIIIEKPESFKEITPYACIAAHVYGNRYESILSDNWICLGNKYKSLKLDDENCGLKAALYKKIRTAEYVYAFAGTRGRNIKDWKANVGQLSGFSDQYERAGEIACKLSHLLGTEKLTMVGHSKGGGQAAYCAIETGCRAITFNPAGLGVIKLISGKKFDPEINAYIIVNDPLNLVQILAHFVHADITADGCVHYFNSKETPIHKGHGIDAFLRLGGLRAMKRIKKVDIS
ncbi:MAG: hypothetical protein J6X22_07240 [Muribaculaceae bacterium]|nr:hypothetical protein [Muribaculaceae bacterium]